MLSFGNLENKDRISEENHENIGIRRRVFTDAKC